MKQSMQKIIVFLLVNMLLFSGCSVQNTATATEEKETTTTQSQSTSAEATTESVSDEDVTASNDLKPIKIILDWTPNTNHTGLYAAKELGLFEKAGFDVSVMQPPEGSTTQLIGAGGGELGISFQDTLAKNFVSNTPLPVTAVAAILQHNTSGVISLKETGIDAPKEMTGKKYSTWDDPIELALLEKMVNDDGGDFSQVELVPFGTDVISALNTDSQSAWVFYAWDGIAMQVNQIETNYLPFVDYIDEADYYTPVIIANNEWLKNNDEDAKKIIAAIVEGYEYAAKNPKESADFLLKNAPELDKDLVYASQEWISNEYIDGDVPFGYIDAKRWNTFYSWLYENGLIEKAIAEDFGFSNDYLPSH